MLATVQDLAVIHAAPVFLGIGIDGERAVKIAQQGIRANDLVVMVGNPDPGNAEHDNPAAGQRGFATCR